MSQKGETAGQIAAQALAVAAPIAETIVEVMFPGAGSAVVTALKIAAGLAAKAPQAEALFEQFKSGQEPTQAELDAYADDEDGSYNRLMADIAAARKKPT